MKLVIRGAVGVALLLVGISLVVFLSWGKQAPPTHPALDSSPCVNRNQVTTDIQKALEDIEHMLSPMIEKLEDVRKDVIKKVAGNFQPYNWEVNDRRHTRLSIGSVAHGYSSSYFDEISLFPDIKTIKVEHSIQEMNSIMPDCFYSGSFSILNKTVMAADADQIPFAENIQASISSVHGLQPHHFCQGLPERYPLSDDKILGSFLHVIPNGAVFEEGQVWHKDLIILAVACSDTVAFPYQEMDVTHDEVFTIAQHWGNNYFHAAVEGVPRLVPYLPFLLKHQNIKIHIRSPNGFVFALLGRLGIQPERILFGNIQAPVIYLPGGTKCGRAGTFQARLTSLYYRNTLPGKTLNEDKKLIILIQRSQKRYLLYHDEILQMLKTELAPSYNLDVRVFSDTDLPSFGQTLTMFNRAVAVVAPHGAGLSNILFSDPKTVIIEGLCAEEERNICFARLSYVLGHIYYGIDSPKSRNCGPIDMTPSEVKEALGKILDRKLGYFSDQ